MEASGGADTAPISAAPMRRYADTPEAPCADMPISGVCRYADIGIEALRGDIGISAAIAEDPEPLGDAGWRVEVLKRGKYWQWRKGHGRNRKARYGGRFALLPPERQAAYFENVRRRNAHPGDGPGDLPAGRAGGPPGGGGRLLVAL
jgi:hypothetical protein